MTKEERFYRILQLLIQHRSEPIALLLKEAEAAVYGIEAFAQKQHTPSHSFVDFLNSLTVRSRNCLIMEGIDSFAKLMERGEIGLIKAPGMGRKSVDEIRDTLAIRGFVLPR